MTALYRVVAHRAELERLVGEQILFGLELQDEASASTKEHPQLAEVFSKTPAISQDEYFLIVTSALIDGLLLRLQPQISLVAALQNYRKIDPKFARFQTEA